MMIISAIASQRMSPRNVSRETIAAYLQQNYPVSTGGRFNSALGSALQSGINDDIFVCDEQTKGFDLTDDGRKLQRQQRNNSSGARKKRKRRKLDKTTDPQTFNFKFNINLTLNRDDDKSSSYRARHSVVASTTHPDDGDSNETELPQSDQESDDQFGQEIDEIVLGNARNTHCNRISRPLMDILPLRGQSEHPDFQKRSMVHTALLEHINSVEEPSDLLCIASHPIFFQIMFNGINFGEMQNFFRTKIHEMDYNSARIVHFGASSINNVLPEDVIQHILSFGHLNQNRTVCQQWNRLNQQNETNVLRAMYNEVDDRNLPSLDRGGEIWIIHPTRPRLHPIEIRRGYRGPLSSPEQLPLNCSVRALLHMGHFGLSRRWTGVQYVGLSPLRIGGCRIKIDLRQRFSGELRQLHFENLRVDFGQQADPFRISRDDNITFKKCTLQMNHRYSALEVLSGAVLNVTDCTLRSLSLNRRFRPICISSTAANVTIKSNKFIHCERCVEIRAANPSLSVDPLANVEITNNSFRYTRDRHLLLIAATRDKKTSRMREQCIIRGNFAYPLRSGVCDFENSCIDANTLHVREPQGPSVSPDSSFDSDSGSGSLQ